jgi:hypothetical protein
MKLWSAARALRLELSGVDNVATPNALDLLNGFPDSDD